MKTDTGEVGISRRIDAQNGDELEHLASFFRLLSDRARLNLLFLLADGERNVSALCDSMALPVTTQRVACRRALIHWPRETAGR